MQYAWRGRTRRENLTHAARLVMTVVAAVTAAITTAGLPAQASPGASFAPGEGTGKAWCPYYGGVSLGSYRDVFACTPATPGSKKAGRTPFDSYGGFQCTELANRFLYLMTGHVLFANEEGGNYVALAGAEYRIPVAASGTPGVLPAAGDVISMWGGRSKQLQNGGRTEVAVVTKVSATAAGWTITTLNQGDPSDTDGARGFNTITVSPDGRTWSALSGFYSRFDWLKLVRSGGGPGATGTMTWRSAAAPAGPAGPAGQLLSVACTSTADCTAAGLSGTAAMLVYQTGGRWRAAAVPAPSTPQTGAQLDVVTCNSQSACLAAGFYRGAGGQQGLLVSGHAAAWTATRAPLPASAAAFPHVVLTSAACAPAGSCVVAGGYTGRSRAAYPLLLTGRASAWSGHRAPLPADAARRPAASLTAVACPAAGHCVAVGSYRDTAGNEQAMIVTQTAAGWTAIRGPLPASAVTPGASLTSVSCASATVCAAAGTFSAGQRGMILTGSGTVWHATATPLPAGTSGHPRTVISRVVCPAVTACLAVGSYADGRAGIQGLLLTGHGGSWRATRAPLPADAAASQGSPGVRLASVACSTATSCIAAGQYTDTAGEAGLLLLRLHTGAWSVSRGPLPANDESVGSQAQGTLGPPSIASVSCPAASSCLAVGTYPARGAGMEGLVETGRP